MKNRKLPAAVLACAAVLCVLAAAVLYFSSRGAEAVEASAYMEVTAELEAGSELAALPDSTGGVPGMILAADDAELSLYYNAETTEIAVKDKRTGQIWYSNPEGRNEDTLASGFEKELLSSQLTVLFRDAVGTLESYTNFAQSISSKQFTAESLKNGLRITYTIGDTSAGIDALPRYISQARLEEKVLSKLDASTAKYVATRYYPKEGSPDIMERIDAQVSKPLVLKKMTAAFVLAGYSAEDLAQDNAENGIGGGSGTSKPNFVVPLEYRLEEGSLVVTVPVNQVKESGQYQIRSLELLNMFGAADRLTDGYMLVPDGSGSLIRLNNGKVKEEQYVQRVYGPDPNDNSYRRGQVSQNARMPVFGMKAGDGAWFAVIEKGDAIASIAADISGKKNSYNFIHSSYSLRGEDELELYTGATIQEIQLLSEEIYKGDIQVRYSFLSGDKASYSGMAELYRDKLVAEKALTPLAEEQSIPFYLDMLGAVDKQKSLLGVPYRSEISMTSFRQAALIAGQLKQDGIGRLLMRYTGWSGKGVNHSTPDKLKTESVLGSRSELTALRDQLAQDGGTLFPDVAFQQIYHNDGGFTPSSDAARFVTREEAQLYPYNRALNRMDMTLGGYYLLSPAKLPYYVDSFMDKYAGFGMEGVSLRDLGNVLSSDFRASRVIQRETAKAIVMEQLDRISQDVDQTMVSGGNAYAWPYADHLIHVPESSSGFALTDETVPFYQMVVHGFISYTGAPVNLSDEQDMHTQLLHSIELGSAPYFSWSYEPSSKLKFTHFDSMYATSYLDWYEQAVSMYKEVNEVLSPVQHAQIVNHTRHQEGVVEVQYSNGISIYVNYTGKDVSVQGIAVGAGQYVIEGEPS
ncbi:MULTISPECIES: DUF5696 domain-containing protein [unclassified Paenibacillus]|uniref:DUF5696 domain-containing protein n=1 Tax=unclassified Paenibacillus TaxID=185978 RepID=UPI00240768A2|nr:MULTISPECIES: DUF5696 domain-containing protein [unclassified Paenibacillus]MDF9844494.1 hypothetical protein [Paenibacillus sp. PastF-2]MDF9851098.1 hypothetical protein [Paenibacillus sp. PastM-2]MDF9857670.1 hypothetical protein [Paenibacillus sp. PastF-1]MDH6482936.1 hypothetical protein [Paenibacillus sp. PastH-2]MDH6510361.1 hypothetical protein [Paenibacillus sp. PastM-3]